MNENLNLCEILKGCEGIELYSVTHGTVKLTKIYGQAHEYPIEYRTIGSKLNFGSVTKEGRFYNYTDGECILFPSKDQRDWSKFERPISINAPMMCRNKSTLPWVLYKYLGKIDGKHCVEYYSNSVSKKVANFNYMIPYEKFDPSNIEKSLKYNIQK